MMREGKPELYFLLILYQNFFDLSNPNFGNMELCGGLPFSQTRRVGRYVVAFSGNSRYGEQPLDAQEKLRIDLWCGKSVRGVRPRPAENPHLLVYHIQINLSIGNLHKKKESFSALFNDAVNNIEYGELFVAVKASAEFLDVLPASSAGVIAFILFASAVRAFNFHSITTSCVLNRQGCIRLCILSSF